MLKALKVARLTGPLAEPVVSTQDRRDGAGGGHIGVTECFEASLEFATTPGRMLLAKLKNLRFDVGSGFCWRGVGSTRAIVQVGNVAGSVAFEPLVRGGATDAETATEFRNVTSLDGGETDKLGSLRHGG